MLRDTRGHLPTTDATLETMKITFTQFLNITKPHVFTRTYAAEEQEENTTNTYIIDGEVLSASIPETVALLDSEVRHLRQSSPNLITPANHAPRENAFALDAEDPDDGEIEDLSCISSQEGLGDSCSEVREGEKVKAVDAYYQYKRAHRKIR